MYDRLHGCDRCVSHVGIQSNTSTLHMQLTGVQLAPHLGSTGLMHICKATLSSCCLTVLMSICAEIVMQQTAATYVRSRLRGTGRAGKLPVLGLAVAAAAAATSGLGWGSVLPDPCPLLVSDTAGLANPPLPLLLQA